jgi:AcrR family transcriptional regulator
MNPRAQPRSRLSRKRAGRIARAGSPPDFSAREQLIDAASQLMSDRHSIDVSLSEIAAHSGLNSALVKYYFGNKDGLLLALVEREAAAALRDVRLLLALELPPTQKLRRHIAAIINNFFGRPYLNRLLHSFLDERKSQTKSAAHVRRLFVKPLLALQAELLEQGVRAGEFKPTDPVLFYVSVLGACDHLFNARYVLRGAKGGGALNDALRARYVDHVCDVFINGVAKAPARAAVHAASRRSARLAT